MTYPICTGGCVVPSLEVWENLLGGEKELTTKVWIVK
jgi:hypothetical protein